MRQRRTTLSYLVSAVAVAVGAWLVWVNRAGLLPGESSRPEQPDPPPLRDVSALGRIEPRYGVIRLSGPPRPAVVIKELHVEEGDVVHEGQIVAVVQGIELQKAEVLRLRAELKNATREVERQRQLRERDQISEAAYEAAELRMESAAAGLAWAEADLDLSSVRSPIEGRILEVHAREGERAGDEGIVELGDTDRMYAIAEVYETDIGRVAVGQRARMSSPALTGTLTGEVERIGLLVGKQDTLDTDPVADADARVVEVEIRLDDPASASRLTNLRVEVVIETGGAQ